MVKLPIDNYERQIVEVVSANDITIISAETGTGKSTRIPMMLWRQGYRVVVTEPRRIAASSLATRVSEENNMTLGETIGYATGFESKYTDETDVLFCTDGLLLVRELTDNKIKKEVLIIDEVHEMNLNIETLLACIKHQQNRDYKVIIMSATLDTKELENFFKEGNSVGTLKCKGEQYEVSYSQCETYDFFDEIKNSIISGYNTLVFVPGKSDIEEVFEKVSGLSCEKLALHGELTYEEQKKCFESYNQPKLVVATNIAQTSITIPDIDSVIDTGLVKVLEIKDGIESLTTRECSKADIIQRCGRAGRTKPGRYVLCSRISFDQRYEVMQPEIYRLNLEQIVLRLATIGLDATKLQFLHQPSIEAIENAKQLLITLSALNENGEITEVGNEMAKMPVSARSARMLIEAKKYGCLKTACIIAAVLENGTLLAKNGEYYPYEVMCNASKSDLIYEVAIYEYIKENAPVDFKKENINSKTYFRVNEYVNKLYNIFKEEISAETEENNQHEENLIKVIFSGMPEVYNGYFERCYDFEDRQYFRDKKSMQYPSDDILLGKPRNIEFYDTYKFKRSINILGFVTRISIDFLKEMCPEQLTEQVENIQYSSWDDKIYQTKHMCYKGMVVKTEYCDVADPELLQSMREEYNRKYRISFTENETPKPEKQRTLTLPSGKTIEIEYDWQSNPYVDLCKSDIEDETFPERLKLDNSKSVILHYCFHKSYTLSGLIDTILNEELKEKVESYKAKEQIISSYSQLTDVSEKIGEVTVVVEKFSKRKEVTIYTYITKDKKGNFIFKYGHSDENSVDISEVIRFFFEKEAEKKFNENIFFFNIKGKRTLTNKGSRALNQFREERKMVLDQINTSNFADSMEYLELVYEEAKKMLDIA